jgi:hypothetical protein
LIVCGCGGVSSIIWGAWDILLGGGEELSNITSNGTFSITGAAIGGVGNILCGSAALLLMFIGIFLAKRIFK